MRRNPLGMCENPRTPLGLYFLQIGKILKFNNFRHSIVIRTVVSSLQNLLVSCYRMLLVVLAFKIRKFLSIKNQEKQRDPPRIYVVQLKTSLFYAITHIFIKKREPQVLDKL